MIQTKYSQLLRNLVSGLMSSWSVVQASVEGNMLGNVRKRMKEGKKINKKVKDYKSFQAWATLRCAGSFLLVYFFSSLTKHLWICNDVYMHFLVHTKCFGLNHCKHVNKRLSRLLTAIPIENTWKLTNHNETNPIMHATLSASMHDTVIQTFSNKKHFVA